MASLEHRSFYYAYFYTEAGGGFYENDFVTSNLELIKKYVLRQLQVSPYMLLEYGLYLDITKIENGVVTATDIQPFEQTTVRVEGIEAEFVYKPKKGVFSTKLNKKQKQALQAMIQTHEENPDLPSPMHITVAWDNSKLVPLEGDLATEGDTLEKPYKFEIFHPIQVGSNFSGQSEAAIAAFLEPILL
jgi:hypothetical protein